MNVRKHYIEELNTLYQDILKMGTLVEESLRRALTALQNQDKNLAGEVKRGDDLINRMQLELEDRVTTIIATEQPVAGDLRELITALKVVADLERIGDHAVHVAKAVIKLADKPYLKPLNHIGKMTETGIAMVREALTAFMDRDAAKAEAVARMDDEIDSHHRQLIEELLHIMKEHPEHVEQATRLILLSRFLERMGDHVTNICECIVYSTNGRHVELNL